jgi:hypothetical protein
VHTHSIQGRHVALENSKSERKKISPTKYTFISSDLSPAARPDPDHPMAMHPPRPPSQATAFGRPLPVRHRPYLHAAGVAMASSAAPFSFTTPMPSPSAGQFLAPPWSTVYLREVQPLSIGSTRRPTNSKCRKKQSRHPWESSNTWHEEVQPFNTSSTKILL